MIKFDEQWDGLFCETKWGRTPANRLGRDGLTTIHNHNKGRVGRGTRYSQLPQGPGLRERTGEVEARGVEHCDCMAGPTRTLRKDLIDFHLA